jgi:hypothetical protein
MGTEQDEALDVLRAVWRGRGQVTADLETGKACKRMVDVGFDDFAGESDEERTKAWRARLEREGKLRPGSVRDLILGPAESRSN